MRTGIRMLAFGVSVFLVIQSITTQCIGTAATSLYYAPQLSTSSTGFIVQSSSPIAPTGVTVLSDRLVIEGPLEVDGNLPFLGTVALNGAIPTTGAGSVSHSCGSTIGITSELAPGAGIGVAAPVIGAPLLGTRSLVSGPIGAGPAFSAGSALGISPLRGPALGSGRGRGIVY